VSVESSTSNVERSGASRAVFVSYAREDADVARRIADELRDAGLEVWFDQDELRGGEAWDAKIKKQIRECTLFLAVISATTQSRGEGYFRREWRQAAERMQDMATGIPFLVPVAIDDTLGPDALVPDEFMRVQWSRLAGGQATPEFVAQVKNLLGGGAGARRRPTIAPMTNTVSTAPMRTRPPMTALPPLAPRPPAPVETVTAVKKKKSGRKAGLLSLLVVLLAGGAGAYYFFVLRPEEPVAPPPRPVAKKPAAPPAPVVAPAATTTPAAAVAEADKSIAVLPFTNMSEDKDSGYFADGIHEDILTNLAHIAALRVVSRTSVMEYRGKTENIRAIAQKLGVAFILEGSVRRAGNKVRVTGQLIHAATDEHVWAQSYDRDLTDVFAIQAELSQEIAKAMSAALSPQEQARLDHPAVVNPAAYDLLLRSRQIDREGNDTRQELETEEALLQKAVALDPSYASAWAGLSSVHAQMIFNALDTSEARLAKSRAAIETARRLDPDHPDVLIALGTFYYYGLRDYPHALEQFERITRQWPNNYFGHFLTGLVQRRQGRGVESLANLRRAAEVDPGSPEIARSLMISFGGMMRRYADAIAAQEHRVQLLPESLRESFEVARLKYYLDGSTKAGDELLAGPVASRAPPAVAAGYRKLWAAMKGDLATAARLDGEFPDAWAPALGSGGGSPAEYALNNAVVLAVRGDVPGARKRVEKYPAELRARLVNEPQNAFVLAQLAQIEALLGHKKEALAAAQRARTLLPDSLDPLSSRVPHQALAFALAWNGDKAAAVAELRQLLATGGQLNVFSLKNGPWFAPLKDDPAFKALLADPKNNQPLY
jgi:TolB-like protein/Tfp pilus assembly protein PilF